MSEHRLYEGCSEDLVLVTVVRGCADEVPVNGVAERIKQRLQVSMINSSVNIYFNSFLWVPVHIVRINWFQRTKQTS